MTDNATQLDQSALDALREMTGDDPEFLEELIDAFISDSNYQLQEIAQAAMTGDADMLRRAAHSLKSNGSTFGATELARLCQITETHAMNGDLTGLDTLLAQISSECGKVREALAPLGSASRS